MIIGSVVNYERERAAFHPLLQKCIKYLRDTDFSTMTPGRYELDGDKVFVLVQNYFTEPSEIRKAESHERYIDIQYVARGEENMGFALVSGEAQIEEDLLLEKDIAFYGQIENQNELILSQGVYVILFPWDIHQPACISKRPSFVTKIIIKIKISEIGII